MGNKKSNDEQNENEGYEFLNERVVKDIRKEFTRYIRLVLIIALFISIAALVIYAGLRTEIKDLADRMEENERAQTSLSIRDTTDAEGRNIDNLKATDFEASLSFGSSFTEEEINNMVVVIEHKEKDMYAGEKNASEAQDKYFSGIIVAKGEDMYVFVYNAHLLKDEEVTVYYAEQGRNAVVTNCLDTYNFSIIRVEGKEFAEGEMDNVRTVLMSDKEGINNSKDIILIGNPVKRKNNIEKGRLTLTENTVSILDAGLRLDITDINAVYNETGFIFNDRGILLGMAVDDNFSQKVSMIEICDIKAYISRVLNKNSISYIGIYGREVTDEVIEKIDKDMPHGIYISNTKDASPAYKAGIMSGDVLVSVGGKEVLNFSEYYEAISSCRPGQQVRVAVMRKGKDGYKKIGYEVIMGELN